MESSYSDLDTDRSLLYLKTLLDNTLDHIYFKDINHRFTTCNKQFLSLLPLNGRESLEGKKNCDFFDEVFSKSIESIEDKVIMTQIPIVGNLKKTLVKGKERYISVSTYPIFNCDNLVIGTMGMWAFLSNTNLDSNRNVNTLLKDLNHLNRALEKISNLDQLTGLYNRRYYYNSLNKIFSDSSKEENKLNIIVTMFDIDDFKSVNDTLGHMVGDKILIYFAKNLQDVFGYKDICCRYGGDEFIVISTRPKNEVLSMIQTLKENLEKDPFTYKNSPLKRRLTFSAGMSCMDEIEDVTLDKITEIADNRLYISKNKGKNTVTYN